MITLFEPLRHVVDVLGEFFVFVGSTLGCVPKLWHRRVLFFKHCEFIGVTSTGIILVAAIFMGAVLGYQLYISFKFFGAEALLGGSVGVSLFRELAPVMGAIMVTGRAGAAIAAEIATMKITEQVDALEVMAVDPIEYLVTPRVFAGLFMMPIIAAVFAVVGTLAAALVACGVMGLDPSVFWHQFSWVVDRIDIIHCVTKGAVFGLAITLVACFCGYRAVGGARAVGLATRSTVVASCLVILFCDYVLTSLLPFGFTKLKAM